MGWSLKCGWFSTMAEYADSFYVSAPARLHLGLHDCGYATRRIFGGVGVSIDGFPTTVESSRSDTSELQFDIGLQPSERTINEAQLLTQKISQEIGEVSVTVRSLAPEHHGFGSKTSLLLAIAQSAFLAAGYNPYEQKARIVELSRRGGTSGIGVNSFWTGGLVVDGGHKAPSQDRLFLPSSERRSNKVPPVIVHANMPRNWVVQTYYDPEFRAIEGDEEKALFQSIMPLSHEDIHKTISATYHGIVPAVIEADLEQFGRSEERRVGKEC